MVKIPSFTRREENAVVDENRAATDETVVRDRTTDSTVGAERVDRAERAERVDRAGRTDRAERPTLWGRWSDRDRGRVSDPATGRATPPAPPTPAVVPTSPAGPNAPTAAERRLAGTDLHDDTRPTEPVTETRPEPTAEVPAGPKPRTSVLATLSLVFAISGAFLVLSGALAGWGIAVGAIGFLMAVSAFAATRKRHVAGKLDAMLGLLIGGAAVVIGILAFTGAFAWPTTDADWVERLRGWLDSQFVDRI
ncbi:hypothetical protein Ais01nite_24850 [Asanoa ishikariensis]|uniref:Thrombospondin n=1 Tax=Asanoa ishikariensis TaxID=137265 RepID=A0A1H3R371_9ACTN|nr:hypothetical protein [Asanoa ishikariensis]GIF64450.1 hypothetical protein Ais01nite_24850 [Asanoa ishikariensis]SDZ20234.1 hypothetical protein SAMN05421684_3434 [Asanoa ishikariensis]